MLSASYYPYYKLIHLLNLVKSKCWLAKKYDGKDNLSLFLIKIKEVSMQIRRLKESFR